MSIVLAFTLLLTSMLSGAAVAAPKKTDATFNLALQALMGKDNTELTMQVYSNTGDYMPPQELKKVELEVYDTITGKKVIDKKFKNVSNYPNIAALTLNNIKRHQVVNTKITFKHDELKGEQTLTGETQVLLRPDLVLDDLQAPSHIAPNEQFIVTADLKELNGDLGDAARVDVVFDGVVLGTLNEVYAAKGGVTPIAIPVSLKYPGTYPMQLKIIKTGIPQYDTSNDVLDFTVTVEEKQQTNPLTDYSVQYDYSPSYAQHLREWVNGSLFYAYDYEPASFESFSMNAQVPGDMLNGGSMTVSLQGAGGGSYSFTVPVLTAKEEASMYNPFNYEDRNSGLMVTVYPNPGGPDVVSLTKNAGFYEQSYFTEGTWQQLSYAEGEFALNEKDSVAFTISITNNTGETFSLSDVISLDYSPTQYDDTWNYQSNTTHSWGFMDKYAGFVSSYVNW